MCCFVCCPSSPVPDADRRSLFGISAWRNTYESTLRIGGTIDIVFRVFKSKDTFTQSSSIPIVSSLARICNLLRIPAILQLTHSFLPIEKFTWKSIS